MRIGGFMPLSLSDYPGRVAAVVFTQGCNMRCPFCHNGELLPHRPPTGRLISADDVFVRLKALRNRLDGVVVSGGEPTMQRALPQFLTTLRRFGLSIKIDTNGAYPERLKALLQAKLVDYVAMDIKAPPYKYDVLTGVRLPEESILASMRLIAESGVAHHFRTTYVPQLLTEEDMAQIRGMIPENSPYHVQKFVPLFALDPQLRAEA